MFLPFITSLLLIAEPAKSLAPAASVKSLPSPAGEVAAAWRDAGRLPADHARQTRYLSLYNVPAEQRAAAIKVLTFHVNSLSREADLVRPRRVTDSLVAVELDSYGWPAAAWERLADADPWFHAQVQSEVARTKEEVRDQEYGHHIDGKWVRTRVEKERVPVTTKETVKQTVLAPWLPVLETTFLVAATGSQAPVLRADWWIDQTGQQRGERGYYEFLGLKALADAEKLAGLDRKAAATARREVAAIITDSGVTLNNRQIFRLGAVSGGWWETRDTVNSVGKKNAVRNLDGDFDHDAGEIYFTLPNGLFGLALADKAGKLAATAPDTIASDGASTNTDRRVRVGVSCIRCHVEGLRPIDDWSRKVFRVGNETALASPDREKSRRLKQLYLGPLQRSLTEDRAKYAETLLELTGLKPDELSKAYAAAWAQHESAPILPADAAREIGCTEEELIGALKAYQKAGGLTDLALAGWTADPPVPIRREHLEEQAPVLFTLLKGQ